MNTADRDARVSRYLADEAAARAALETHTPEIRARLEAWQKGQGEWFSDTLLEIVAEFVAFDDARAGIAAMPDAGLVEAEKALIVAWLRRRQAEWDVKVIGYREAGNNGPYLGTPSYAGMADAIERGDHLPKEEARSKGYP